MDYREAPRHTNDSPIARIRIERGLTQAQLAERLGMPQQTVSRWEQGTRTPSAKSLKAMAGALGCSMDELV